MKKFLKTLAATLATVLVLGMTVSAAGSTDTSATDTIKKQNAEDVQATAKAGATKAIDSTGAVYTVNLVASSKEDEEKVEAWSVQNGLGNVLIAFDMTISGGKAPYTVTLKIPGLKNDTAYTVLHFENGNWQKIACTNNNDGTITFQVNSCSPFAVVEGATASAVVAPKTGEVIAFSAIMAIIMVAGAVLCAKKARLQK